MQPARQVHLQQRTRSPDIGAAAMCQIRTKCTATINCSPRVRTLASLAAERNSFVQTLEGRFGHIRTANGPHGEPYLTGSGFRFRATSVAFFPLMRGSKEIADEGSRKRAISNFNMSAPPFERKLGSRIVK
jgi:hypothetical protein